MTKSKVILGMGTGRCGTASLAKILNNHPDAHVTHEEPPLLPWNHRPNDGVIAARFARMRRERNAEWIGDVASFYLPYVPEIIATEPDVRIICLKRDKHAVVKSFCRLLDQLHPLPTNHWAKDLPAGWHYDPHWSRVFPSYDFQSREECIARYWDEYYERVEILLREFPDQLRVVATEELNDESTVREVLTFAGMPSNRQTVPAGVRENESHPTRSGARPNSDDPMDPRKCAVLVPYSRTIAARCEESLQELESRGYVVRRVQIDAAIDHVHNRLATGAVDEGFEETLWIAPNVVFAPDDVEKVRQRALPICCGICPPGGEREPAYAPSPDTPKLVFGPGGSVTEILYAGMDFLHVRREVYRSLQEDLDLPLCNETVLRFLIPFFLPMVHRRDDGYDYLSSAYSFCQRARDCGYRIMADTTIRLDYVPASEG